MYNNFSKYINLNIYKEFFRLFCNNKYVEYDYFLRADVKSFHEGVTYLYGGVENYHMSNRLFNYIAKGKVNHRITFSEFVYFARELQLSEVHQNLLVFKILAGGKTEYTVHDLLRQFVMTQKCSDFAQECWGLIETYI